MDRRLQLNAIEEAADDGIVVEDAAGAITSWNRAAQLILGYTPDEIIGKQFFSLVPTDRHADEHERRERVKAGTRERFQTRLVLKDGTLIDVDLTLAPVYDEQRVAIGVVSIIHDLAKEKLAADQLRRLVFSDRMLSIGTLAAGVAHEINNPLAFITTNLDMIEEELRTLHGGKGWDEVVALVRDARVGAERIRKIVRSLSTFTRADEDVRAPLDVERVLELAISMASNEIRHRARLTRAYTSAPVVYANEARLAQVFVNLLLNAAEAIPEGQAEQHQIQVSTNADSRGRAIIEIRDSGRGIAPEIQSRIFDPFFTTKSVGEGMGLGLSICHGIVSSLGGELTFRSTVTIGTTFRVVLPPATEPLVTRSKQPSSPPSLKRGRVLIVDDEVIFANSLRRLLSRDHEITVVHSGRQALERLRAGERYDVILCDLMMPDITGPEVHQQLTELDAEQAKRLLFMTGGAFSPSAQQFLDRLGAKWFEKPCDLSELRKAIRRLVG